MPGKAIILSIALVASMAVNLFLGGALLGRTLGMPLMREATGRGGLGPGALARGLSPGDRALFLAAMAKHRPMIRAARLEQQAARAKVDADMTAKNYDPALMAADLTALRSAQARQQEVVHAGLVEALSALTPESRSSLAEAARLRRPAARRPQPAP